MRAAVMRRGQIVVDTVPDPEPGRGEVLVRTLACGICGSDLHALKHGAEMVESLRGTGAPGTTMDPSRDVVMGHEFCAEVLDYGPGCERRVTPGTRVCAMPVGLRDGLPVTVGYSNDLPGGYGERMLLREPLLLPVPDGLESRLAALTEPMAVGLHAVEMAHLETGAVPLVVGCGPVGLAVIAALKLKKVAPIVATDFSPKRREIAIRLGADVVVDPASGPAIASWAQVAAFPGGVLPPGAMPEELSFLPAPPALRPAVIFECVGVPGMIDRLIREAPLHARLVVVGVCMQEDRFQPLLAIQRQLAVQFVLGYTPQEFAATLRHIESGEIPVEPLVTGEVGLDGVAQAFEELAHPDRHAKVVVRPS